jgi:hypothetical protein
MKIVTTFPKGTYLVAQTKGQREILKRISEELMLPDCKGVGGQLILRVYRERKKAATP